MRDSAELEAALARADAADAKVEALEIRLGLRPPKPQVREVVRPAKYVVTRDGDDLAVSWRWSPDWYTTFFMLIWNAIIVGVFVSAGSALLALELKTLFVVPHVMAGLYLGMVAIASFVNRTTIRARDGFLEVLHGPIKIRNRRVAFAVNDVQQLHAVKDASNEGPLPYSLTAVLGDDRQRTLLDRLTDDESRCLEVMFEEHLGIEDRPREAVGG